MTSHANITDFDSVEPINLNRDDVLRGKRQRLGAAAGATKIGLSRYVLGPGDRPMPAHVHADEEEIFYVLFGSGVVWLDGTVYPIGQGDCIVHRAGAEAHAIVAGDDGLDVLAFGSGSTTGITYLPRAKAWWMGPRWLPADGPSPFRLEVAAGPLDVSDVQGGARPSSIVNAEDVPVEEFDRPGYAGYEKLLSGDRSVLSGLRLTTVNAGELSCPPHWHTAEEEVFVVLSGSGICHLDRESIPIEHGSVIVRPPGSRIAHSLHATETGPLTYLVYGQRIANEVVYYPRSNKLNINGLVFRVEPVDYWDGE